MRNCKISSGGKGDKKEKPTNKMGRFTDVICQNNDIRKFLLQNFYE